MIRQSLRTYLVTQAAIAAKVTANGKVHIYWTHLPQLPHGQAFPLCLVYRRATGGHKHDLDGAAGFAAPLFDLDVWGEDSVEVETLGELVREALQGFRGTMGADTIQRLTLDDEQDFFYPATSANDVGRYLIRYRYTIGYRESIPTF